MNRLWADAMNYYLGKNYIAALFVERDGPYSEIAGVEIWDKTKDAKTYKGPYPVIAHPPCERWGRYWSGGPSAKIKRTLGDDNGCFKSALESVRKFGGILEHPEASHAFKRFGLPRPDFNGGWTETDSYGGASCCVSQGHYGHRARKMTWLYAVNIPLPELIWGPAKGKERLDEGFVTAEERRFKRAQGQKPRPRLSVKENLYTPPAFRDLLIRLVDYDDEPKETNFAQDARFR